MADDVVALPPPPPRGGRGALLADPLCHRSSSASSWRPMRFTPRHVDFIFAPPQRLHLFDDRAASSAPSSTATTISLDLQNLKRDYTDDRSKIQPLRFFCRGEPYKFWGLVQGDLHLVCPAEGGTLFLLGTDRLGRDMLIAHHLRRAHLAHHRPDRRLRQLPARHHHRRAGGLLRRLDRQYRPAPDRGHALHPPCAAVAGALRHPAGGLGARC